MSKQDYDWDALIFKFENSNQKMAQFCKKHGVSLYAFKYHKYKKRDMDTKKQTISFAQVKQQQESKQLRFQIDGRVIVLDEDIDEEQLQKIMKGIFS